MPDDRPPISSSRLAANEVTRQSFGTVRRGYDPAEVRSYLELLARELLAAEQRDLDLRELLAEAEQRAAHPVLDQATLSAALGQQSAQVLRNAHDEAARITLAAEEAAAALLRDAHQMATEVQVTAESAAAERIAEAELAAGTVNEQVREAMAARAEEAERDAQAVADEARARGRAMVEQAQEARRRVLADLAVRRRALLLQIEQLRAARDQLNESVHDVRLSVDRILDGLAGADDEARAAAAEVARRQPPAPSEEADLLEVAALAPETAPEEPTVAMPVVTADPVAAEAAPEAPAPNEQAPSEPVDDVGVVPAVRILEAGEVAEEVPGSTTEPLGEVASGTVEELFARIRASSDPDGEPTTVMAEPVTEETPAVEPSEPSEPLDGDAALLVRRDELLGPINTNLGRRVKRALQDDQNRLLDRLRSGSGTWSEDVLGSEEDQRQAFAAAAQAGLADAVAAGAALAAELTPSTVGPDPTIGEQAADGLAGAVVTLLRRRLTGEDGVPTDASVDEAADRVGAAYREWRGERIERLVGDYALGAFSAAVVSAAGPASELRWIPGGDGPPCADCDDNALGGAVSVGSDFPTGHRHPPAHAGCRCLVVPTPN